jgi:hypothetical protein
MPFYPSPYSASPLTITDLKTIPRLANSPFGAKPLLFALQSGKKQ